MQAGRHWLHPAGSDLRMEVGGPDLHACLAAAVAGFAAALAEVPGNAPQRRERLELTGADPTDLLVALVDELIYRLDADGELVAGLEQLDADPQHLRATAVLVPLAATRVHGVAPKAATWHGAELAEGPDGWRGQVTIDL